MTIGVSFSPNDAADEPNAIDWYVDRVREAADAGLARAWFGQLFNQDSLTLAALAGREVPGIEVGTSVVPIFGRHPLPIANQALTAQAATHGRFTLGVGMAGAQLAEAAFGGTWERPILRLREYLTVLRALLTEGEVDFEGETVTARTPLSAIVPGADPVPVMVAAMGPQALRVTGELADGTIPFLVAPRVIERHIVPPLTKAAGGQPRQVIAMVPGVVTADVDGMRAKAREMFAFYDSIPSYRKMLDLAGVERAADLVVIGSEEVLAAEVRRYFEAGATEVVVSSTASMASAEDRRRTWALLGELARS
nr:LLM class F420-dependent oxidoreductase [Kibdelosporangium sp. MJ126-NF4]CEL15800.1 hypothetical protein [Kibdelosporangium sp. MJ126-NF4]CTQ93725.1 hypothetical protein [Kibdelosporangium sp. MJ126-NF4]